MSEKTEWIKTDNDSHEKFMARVAETRPRKFSKLGWSKCIICRNWIHPDVVDCQPCEASTPVYSNLHKYE